MEIDDDLAAWIAGLDDLFALVAGRFFRVEPRLRARSYVRGLLAPLAAKNGWTPAEGARGWTPDGVPEGNSGRSTGLQSSRKHSNATIPGLTWCGPPRQVWRHFLADMINLP